ncbi:cytochrome P450 [Exidia glandulosa HHB12029]|uniref:Cytochrome P450 n=1 Tax=Exidia glandulosa HHB12029 TaxID=1314781 RepID=A0A165P3R4_EXIGL|nr:cytochrome P450 [Exidia glandulosa HHB12029]
MSELDTQTTMVSLFCLGLSILIFERTRGGLNKSPLPPGPPQHGIAGNIKDIPSTKEWESYTAMGKKYGPIVYLRVLTRRIVVVNTMHVAADLFDKRSNIYSDRPRFPMLNELMGWWWNTGLMPYGSYWREHRRVLHHYFNQDAVKRYYELQTRTNLAFLRSLMESPTDFWHHIRWSAGANILNLSYGIEVAPKNDPWIVLADESIESIAKGGLPGSYFVDWLPVFKHLPEWFPGAGFKKRAREWHQLSTRMLHAPLEWVKDQMSQGNAPPSMAAELLEHGLEGRKVPMDVIRNVSAVIYLGGADTTVSIIDAFFLCITLHRDKQRAAQEELDRVVGYGRMPVFSDRESLPYVNAVMLEVMRMFPVTPLGIPRRVMEDDEYAGMRIPKGATVLANIWGMLRDEAEYDNPHVFVPERFVKDGAVNTSIRDPRTVFFGFGKRICAGRHFADSSVWLVVATVLACFNIRPAKDEHGNDIIPSTEMRSGLLSCPLQFECEIVPRSEDARRLILSTSDQI